MMDAAAAWSVLAQVEDPEIPVISVVDLGIVRDVQVTDDGCEVTITPTYSGCPAMQVISDAIADALRGRGFSNIRVVNQLSPAWTTDWMSDAGKAALKGYGIAPPAQNVIDISGLQRGVPELVVDCPNCGSSHTRLVSQFGSTPCKALYQCIDCREPFDYFKCH
jgi:ring-1,2-phenylacetyl-CoA epoxidase subunit PaaD